MNYERAKKLKPNDFKRLCGVTRQTFNQMIKIVENHERSKKKTGRPSKLSLENQVLMTLEYLREYRTYFHIGQSWGLDGFLHAFGESKVGRSLILNFGL